MSFYIDITPIVTLDGDEDVLEADYTIDECVQEGWLDPTVPGGLWTREMHPRKRAHHDGFTTDPTLDWRDPLFGTNMKLNLVKTLSGRWVHEEAKGMRLR